MARLMTGFWQAFGDCDLILLGVAYFFDDAARSPLPYSAKLLQQKHTPAGRVTTEVQQYGSCQDVSQPRSDTRDC